MNASDYDGAVIDVKPTPLSTSDTFSTDDLLKPSPAPSPVITPKSIDPSKKLHIARLRYFLYFIAKFTYFLSEEELESLLDLAIAAHTGILATGMQDPAKLKEEMVHAPLWLLDRHKKVSQQKSTKVKLLLFFL